MGMLFVLAGALGIEPRLAVLETAVLPLNDAPLQAKFMKTLTIKKGLTKIYFPVNLPSL